MLLVKISNYAIPFENINYIWYTLIERDQQKILLIDVYIKYELDDPVASIEMSLNKDVNINVDNVIVETFDELDRLDKETTHVEMVFLENIIEQKIQKY